MADIFSSFKQLYPDKSDDDIQKSIVEIKQKLPDTSDDEIIQSAAKMKAAKDDGSYYKTAAQEQVKQKYGLADRQKLVEQNKKDASGPNVLAGIAALGAGLQGQNAFQAGANFLDMQQGQRDSKLKQFDTERELAMSERDDIQKQDKLAKETDPNSIESKMAQELAVSMGMNPEQAKGLTAARFKEFSPALQKKYEIAERNKDRAYQKEERYARNQEAADRKQMIADDKRQKLQTPYGLANSEDDAKKLKEAHESKANFDSKLNEMISLRKKYGGEVFNREAVARGKQLSKDLLLEYKNMAKLGVLSQSDEDIINAIIPDDPLAFQASSVVGQDPILSNLTKFKADKDKDFATKVMTRTREGLQNYASGERKTPLQKAAEGGKQVVKKQISKSTGKTRILYDDGTSEIIDSKSSMAGL